ncbi:MAG: MFS transporter [Clostridia bacterium]|nr:MFS transporter [Clostridia bacterium]
MTNPKNYVRTKRSCFFTYVAMSSVFSLPPVLFVTFREMYGISYTLLGTLVLINFCTQLIVDLIFTFFTKYFNIHKTIKAMPLLTSAGMIIYALAPVMFPGKEFIGLATGTVIFSVAAGLCEVLLSPLVAAIPSDNPERDMSTLHSLYAYGVVIVVVTSTLFLKFFGTHNWMYLTFFWAVLPIISFILFCASPFPEVNLTHDKEATDAGKRTFGLFLCVLCIFLGSAAENSMTNWISGYMENALLIPKVWGDILGMTSFAILLGIGRTLYAKYGKNISTVLLCGMTGAAVCYLIAGFSANTIACMIACVITGFCTSMLWPGTLIMMEEKFPNPGVAAYALMAAGGDFGGSIAPQILGAVVDKVSASSFAADLSQTLSLSVEQIGMKAGMIAGSLFPILGIALLVFIKAYFKKVKSR